MPQPDASQPPEARAAGLMPDSELTRGPVTNADGHPAAEDLAGSDVAAVELRDVSKRYSAQHAPAVEHVDISIRNGEFFSLLGPSGSGKTTTLRMIAGLELPSAGTIWLQGLDVSNVPAYRRNVNTVFQSYALFPHMRVHENIAYPLKMRKLNRREITRRVAEILDRVGLTGLEQRRPLELSGGQRQRVALARALIGQPAVLLLDEPLGALDLKLREAMLVLLKRLQRDFGITFVYVTHDQVEALAMSDRVAVMNAGRVEQIAPPLELYARPQSAFVAAFIGKTNLLQCVRARGNTVTWHGLKLNVEQLPDPGATEFTLSLRPEAIELGTASRAQANHFSGTVTEVLFLGHEHELRVDVGGGTLIARCGPGSVYARGDTLELGWPSEAAVALEATP